MDERSHLLSFMQDLRQRQDSLAPAEALRQVRALKVMTRVNALTADECVRLAEQADLNLAQWQDEGSQRLSEWIERRSAPLPPGSGSLPFAPVPKIIPWHSMPLTPPVFWQHMVAVAACVALLALAFGPLILRGIIR